MIIDNLGTDGTPRIIRELARKLPAIRTLTYPYDVASGGRENLEAWRVGLYLSMGFKAINARPDRAQVLAGGERDPRVVGQRLTGAWFQRGPWR